MHHLSPVVLRDRHSELLWYPAENFDFQNLLRSEVRMRRFPAKIRLDEHDQLRRAQRGVSERFPEKCL